MSQTLTLELPDEVYAGLAAEAAASGKTVTEVATGRLAPGAAGPSRFLRWAGSADSGLTDLATRVDEFVGRAVHADQERPGE